MNFIQFSLGLNVLKFRIIIEFQALDYPVDKSVKPQIKLRQLNNFNVQMATTF
jgi:hypothetical protein